MKTLQQKKDCIANVLSSLQTEFAEQIEKLSIISKEDEYDKFLVELLPLLGKTHPKLLAEIHLCQNTSGPAQIQNTNIK